MEHSSKNEKKLSETCDIFMNEAVMEKHNVEEQSKMNPSLQFKTRGNLQTGNEEEIMVKHFKKLHRQRKF
jgi:hypothetical protein